jgi:ribosomal protein S18 acetylase RimI-like enzyme
VATEQRWVVGPEPVGGKTAASLLRRYFGEVAGRYYGRPATEDEVDAAMAEEPSDDLVPPGGLFLVARDAGVPVGCVGVRRLDPVTAELTRLYVEPACRGRGAGSALVAAAERAAGERGAVEMRLDTRHDLLEALALYARRGYADIPPYSHGRYAQRWLARRLR